MSVVGHSSFTARNICIFRLWLSRFIQLHFSQIPRRWKKGSSNNRESDFNIFMIWLTMFYYTCNMVNHYCTCDMVYYVWPWYIFGGWMGVKISSHCLSRWSVLFNWRSYRRGPNYHSKRAVREESMLSYVELSPHMILQPDGHLCCFKKSWGQSYCFCRPSPPLPTPIATSYPSEKSRRHFTILATVNADCDNGDNMSWSWWWLRQWC